MINLTDREKAAISNIDESELEALIDQALQNERADGFLQLFPWDCGPYLRSELHNFERSLQELAESKSAHKRGRKRLEALRAGRKLSFALSQMKGRVKTEVEEGQLFYVEDQIYWPHHFSNELRVNVSYRWRRSVEDPWAHGRIEFRHQHNPRPDYTSSLPMRKPSVAKQKQDLQDALSREWEHLKDLALCSVRDFFRAGGDGSNIPASFQAVADQRTLGLNNFSTKFWDEAL
ncbi:hypothetical protein [Tritonibacter mobilis]|uniref:hypothetical protein n=1 Tax=Tritonibacter mobilis TaxID=379347 RepID=UPI0008068F81|nr:hypothetical protein [Tritonibacter mobilis]